MKNKETYKSCSCEVIRLSADDLIATSLSVLENGEGIRLEWIS